MPKRQKEFETADEFIFRTGCLRRFTEGQRVVVIEDGPLYGHVGRVSRVKIAGLGPWSQSPDGTFWNVPEAWVTMEKDVPGNLRRFAKSDSRRNNLVFRADQVMDSNEWNRREQKSDPDPRGYGPDEADPFVEE